MPPFRAFEERVVHLLVDPILGAPTVEIILRDADTVEYSSSTAGYFLTVSHPALPRERVVCHTPTVTGRHDDWHCGFVVFVGDGKLTIECHAWGSEELPAIFRELAVEVVAT